jgi:hypothetical protein
MHSLLSVMICNGFPAGPLHPKAALIVDLRFNTGGDGNVGRQMMDHLQAASTSRRVFVIVGRTTFSAGLFTPFSGSIGARQFSSEKNPVTVWSSSRKVAISCFRTQG